jgi:hypothetical protein
MNKEQLLTEARELLAKSELSESLQDLWMQQLAEATTEQITIFLETAEDAQVLTFATESLQRKLAALGSKEDMQRVVDSEVAQLKTLIKEDVS